MRPGWRACHAPPRGDAPLQGAAKVAHPNPSDMKHATAARNWAQHLESGELVASLLVSLAEGMSTSPACAHLLPRLQELERAIAAADQAAYRAICALDQQEPHEGTSDICSRGHAGVHAHQRAR